MRLTMLLHFRSQAGPPGLGLFCISLSVEPGGAVHLCDQPMVLTGCYDFDAANTGATTTGWRKVDAQMT